MPDGPRIRVGAPSAQSPSVLDSPLEQALRAIAGVLGDSPEEQILGLVGTIDIPGGVGPLQRAIKGLYSRVERVAQQVGAKGVHPNRLRSLLQSGASQEEVAYRKIPELLASHGDQPVTREALQAHLAANPAPRPQVKTRGDVSDLTARQTALGLETDAAFDRAFPSATTHGQPWPGDQLSQLDDANARHWAWGAAGGNAEDMAKLNRLAISPERRAAMLEYGRLANQTRALNEERLAGNTKFAQYQLPGGENYRETLLTLPPDQNRAAATHSARIKELTERRDALRSQLHSGQDVRSALANTETQIDMAMRATPKDPRQFVSSHFDEPNILVHVRSNERTLPTGERGRFLEEVQSDWHQKGKRQGYKTGDRLIDGHDYDWWNAETDRRFRVAADDRWREAIANRNRLVGRPDEVADAPFKDSWPELGLKQQLLEAADDDAIEWLGFTSGKTQAARYNLAKQVRHIDYRRSGDGYELGVVGLDGEGIDLPKRVYSAAELPDVVGKEVADKILAGEGQSGGGRKTLSGIDLQVGGEGMRKFYDEILPKRLEKLVKPFGGTVERQPLTGRTKEAIDAEMDAFYDAPQWTGRLRDQLERLQQERNLALSSAQTEGWVVRLTPEMKAKIKAAGFPLAAIPLAVSHARDGDAPPPNPRLDALLRKHGLVGGGVNAVGQRLQQPGGAR